MEANHNHVQQNKGECVDDVDNLEVVNMVNELDSITPKIGMEFPSQEEAYKFYNRYALKIGFGTRWSTTNHSRKYRNLVISRKFVCAKQGKRDSLKEGIVNDNVSYRRETRVDCKAKMKIIRTTSENWKVSIFVPDHNNHEMSTPSKVRKHLSHQKAHHQPINKNLITQLHGEGITNANIARIVNSFESNAQHLVTPQQVHDHLRVDRKNNLGKNCAQIIRHFMEKKSKDPSFYSSIEVDDDPSV